MNILRSSATRRALVLVLGSGFALLPSEAPALEIPTTLNYQGRLTDNSSTPVPISATLPMTFSIWDSAVAGTQLWTETWDAPNPQVVVSNGLFDVILGSQTPIPLSVFSSGTARWLQIAINGETLTPRQQLTSVGWSFKAEAAGASTTPPGAIIFYDGMNCPNGWSPVMEAEGRYLVGLRPGGTLGAAVGTALTNTESRAVGQHTHGLTQSPHNHVYTPPIQLGTGSGNSSAKVGSATVTSDTLISISVNNAGTVAGTNAPYVQYLVCRKN